MANPFVSGRVPQELKDKLDDFCKKSGKEKTKVLIEALAQYFNCSIPEPVKETQFVTVDMFEELSNKFENEISKLRDEVKALKTSDNNVIKYDNANEAHRLEEEENKINNSDNADNTYDNDEKGREGSISDNADNKVITTENEQTSDKDDITSQNKLPIYKSINSQELRRLTNILPTEVINLKRQVFKKAESKGHEIAKSIRFNPPIEATLRRGIAVNGQKYKLRCEGTDKNEKPIWTLEPNDNNSYQGDILINANL